VEKMSDVCSVLLRFKAIAFSFRFLSPIEFFLKLFLHEKWGRVFIGSNWA